MGATLSAVLDRHPQTPTQVVRRIEARVHREHSALLRLTFQLDADLSRLRIPSASAPRFDYLLWQHTCFEAFIALPSGDAYHELNFAPSGEWAVYAFERYREGAGVEDVALAPRITTRTAPTRLDLEAIVSLERLSPLYIDAPLRLGLSAVVEEDIGSLSYWSLHHRPGAADFHHRDAFALQLEPAARS